MNTSLPAAIAAELDSLRGPDQLQRAAELLRHIAESLEPGYRPHLENAAADLECDAETIRESEQLAAEEHEYALRTSARYRRAVAEGAV